MAHEITDLLPAPGEDAPRILHAGDTWSGQPYVYIDDGGIELTAGKSDRPNLGITIDHTLGTQIHGPVALSDMPENISVAGGYWTLNPMALSCIGSSAAMPIPTLVWSKPKSLQSGKDMTSIASGLGV